jgi:putative alpha-1,2-mannosidase
VLARFGVSFRSADAACQNAEEEIPDWDWAKVEQASQAKWEDVLGRVGLPAINTENKDIVTLLYSSVSHVFFP